ncbi:hypothetical protein [Bombilactobacillus bombi]
MRTNEKTFLQVHVNAIDGIAFELEILIFFIFNWLTTSRKDSP